MDHQHEDLTQRMHELLGDLERVRHLPPGAPDRDVWLASKEDLAHDLAAAMDRHPAGSGVRPSA